MKYKKIIVPIIIVVLLFTMALPSLAASDITDLDYYMILKDLTNGTNIMRVDGVNGTSAVGTDPDYYDIGGLPDSFYFEIAIHHDYSNTIFDEGSSGYLKIKNFYCSVNDDTYGVFYPESYESMTLDVQYQDNTTERYGPSADCYSFNVRDGLFSVDIPLIFEKDVYAIYLKFKYDRDDFVNKSDRKLSDNGYWHSFGLGADSMTISFDEEEPEKLPFYEGPDTSISDEYSSAEGEIIDSTEFGRETASTIFGSAIETEGDLWIGMLACTSMLTDLITDIPGIPVILNFGLAIGFFGFVVGMTMYLINVNGNSVRRDRAERTKKNK